MRLVALFWGAPVDRGETVTGCAGPVYEPLVAVGGPAGRPSRSEPVMTVARSVGDVLSGHVVFQVECIDGMYLNVYVSGLQYAIGVAVRDRPGGLRAPATEVAHRLDRATGAHHR